MFQAWERRKKKKSHSHTLPDPIICVAGRSAPHVEALIDRSKGDTIVDYRGGDDAVVSGIRNAAIPAGTKLLYALDAVSEDNTYVNLAKALDSASSDSSNPSSSQRPKISLVLPTSPEDRARVPPHVDLSITTVGWAHGDVPPAQYAAGGDSAAGKVVSSSSEQNGRDFGFVYFRYFARGLLEGWFKPQPQVVVPGGLGGIQKGLEDLKAGKANAIKFVFRIAETEGLGGA